MEGESSGWNIDEEDLDVVEDEPSREENGTDDPTVNVVPLSSACKGGGTLMMVCDFDKDTTPLYKLLEQSKWDEASDRARSHPHEAKTWIARYNEQKKKLLWKILPFHAAILFHSPLTVLSALLETHPEATSLGDDRGMIPLHLAFRQKRSKAANYEGLLEMLLLHYPRGVHVKDKRGKVPMDYCKQGQVFASSKLLRLYANATEKATQELAAQEKDKAIQDLQLSFETRLEVLVKESSVLVESLQQENASIKLQLEHAKQETPPASCDDDDKPDLEDMDTDQLRSELRSALSLLGASKRQNHELEQQLLDISNHQKQLSLLLTEQQQELQVAQSIHNQWLQALVQQEEDDGVRASQKSADLMELAEKIQTMMGQAAAAMSASSSSMESPPRHQTPFHTDAIPDSKKATQSGDGNDMCNDEFHMDKNESTSLRQQLDKDNNDVASPVQLQSTRAPAADDDELNDSSLDGSSKSHNVQGAASMDEWSVQEEEEKSRCESSVESDTNKSNMADPQDASLQITTST